MTILVIDLSSLAHRLYHAFGRTQGGNATSDAVLEQVRSLARDYEHTTICCDVPGGRTFRHEICTEYKSGRRAWEPDLVEQYHEAAHALEQLGPVFVAPGFEADDLVATVVAWARSQTPRHDVVIGSSDKDLLQLVGPGVAVYSFATHEVRGAAYVREKYGVEPHQWIDFASMAGDATDGVAGIPKIGAVKASKILQRWGTLAKALDVVFTKSATECHLQPSTHAALLNGLAAAELARRLVTLRCDAPIDCESVVRGRAVA